MGSHQRNKDSYGSELGDDSDLRVKAQSPYFCLLWTLSNLRKENEPVLSPHLTCSAAHSEVQCQKNGNSCRSLANHSKYCDGEIK